VAENEADPEEGTMPTRRGRAPGSKDEPPAPLADNAAVGAADRELVDPDGAAGRPTMTPAEALERHLEWLEDALGTAKADEARRVRRLEHASTSNRDKRRRRLEEVRDEIRELTALLRGIRDLEDAARSAGSAAGRSARPGVLSRRVSRSTEPAAG
jgi:hypothetical protein